MEYLATKKIIKIPGKVHHEDPHTTFFCTPQDAGVVKDARV